MATVRLEEGSYGKAYVIRDLNKYQYLITLWSLKLTRDELAEEFDLSSGLVSIGLIREP